MMERILTSSRYFIRSVISSSVPEAVLDDVTGTLPTLLPPSVTISPSSVPMNICRPYLQVELTMAGARLLRSKKSEN